jgi:hypothetical protein
MIAPVCAGAHAFTRSFSRLYVIPVDFSAPRTYIHLNEAANGRLSRVAQPELGERHA